MKKVCPLYIFIVEVFLNKKHKKTKITILKIQLPSTSPRAILGTFK